MTPPAPETDVQKNLHVAVVSQDGTVRIQYYLDSGGDLTKPGKRGVPPLHDLASDHEDLVAGKLPFIDVLLAVERHMKNKKTKAALKVADVEKAIAGFLNTPAPQNVISDEWHGEIKKGATVLDVVISAGTKFKTNTGEIETYLRSHGAKTSQELAADRPSSTAHFTKTPHSQRGPGGSGIDF